MQVFSDEVSSFRDDQDRLHWQERDVAKYWSKAGASIALVCNENQTVADSNMPAHILSYDATSYKDQVSRIKDSKDPLTRLFPVVTIVLHYGDKPWRKNKTLYECLEDSSLHELQPFVNDYKPFICDVAFFQGIPLHNSEAILARSQSSSKIVARLAVRK